MFCAVIEPLRNGISASCCSPRVFVVRVSETEIHNEFVSYARRAGALRLLLAVLEENESARRFWLRLGYRKVKDYPPKPFGNRFHACSEFEMVL
jgi:GNAT superfamily N-acetyltransferase